MQHKVLYSRHQSVVRGNPLGFIFAIVLIPVMGLGILILLMMFLKARATKLVIDDREILLEKGLLSKERTEFDIHKIRTVKVSQGLLDRMFGIGNIELYTSGDAPEVIVKSFPEPNRIRDIIKKVQHGEPIDIPEERKESVRKSEAIPDSNVNIGQVATMA